MNTELSVYQQPPRDLAQATFDLVPSALELAKQIAPTSFVPAGLRNNVAATLAAILTGAEVGLPPMASLAQIFVIDGKPGMYGTGMRALILSRGHHLRWGEQTNTRVTLIGRRRGEDNETTVTWTIDDAARAELASKPMWRKYPRSMLMGRATGELGRAIFADVIAGIPYTVEELQDGEFLEAPAAAALAAAGTENAGPAAPDPPKRRMRRTRRESAPPPAPPLPTDGPPDASEPTSPSGPPVSGAPPSVEGPPGPQAPAGEPAPGETMTLAQQIAMHCREATIDRAQLVQAVTGATRASEITREQAVAVLEAAKAIARGEARLLELDGVWQVLPVEDDPGSPREQGDLFDGRS